MSQMAILSPVASVIFALLIACVCLFLVVKNWLSDQPALQRGLALKRSKMVVGLRRA